MMRNGERLVPHMESAILNKLFKNSQIVAPAASPKEA